MHSISIIIPVYNPPENQLRACLDSVLDQEGVILDIIAVNDGSTNSAPQVLNEYKEKYPDIITVINQENQGNGQSKNNGYRYAKGEYVWFVDSDDQVRPNCIKGLIDAMVEHNAEHIVFNHIKCSQKDKNSPFPPLSDKPVIEVPKEYNFSHFHETPWCRILKKSFLDRVKVSFISGPQDDQPESIKWTCEANKILLSPDCHYKYIITPNSVEQKTFYHPLMIQSTIKIVDTILEEAKKYPQYKHWINFYAHEIIKSSLRKIYRSRKTKEAKLGDTMQQFKHLEEEYKKRDVFALEDRIIIDMWDTKQRELIN